MVSRSVSLVEPQLEDESDDTYEQISARLYSRPQALPLCTFFQCAQNLAPYGEKAKTSFRGKVIAEIAESTTNIRPFIHEVSGPDAPIKALRRFTLTSKSGCYSSMRPQENDRCVSTRAKDCSEGNSVVDFGASILAKPGKARVVRAPLRTWKERSQHARKLQRVFRQWIACRLQVHSFREARSALRCIQKWWRNLLRRQGILYKWFQLSKSIVLLNSSVCQVQQFFYRVFVKSFYYSATEVAVKLQESKTRYREEFRAALRLQSWWKRASTLFHWHSCVFLFLNRIRRAVLQLQSFWRGMQTRRQCRQHIEYLYKARVRRRYPVRGTQPISLRKTHSANSIIAAIGPGRGQFSSFAPLSDPMEKLHGGRFTYVGSNVDQTNTILKEQHASALRRLSSSSQRGIANINSRESRNRSYRTSQCKAQSHNLETVASSPCQRPRRTLVRSSSMALPEKLANRDVGVNATIEGLLLSGVLSISPKIAPALSLEADDLSVIRASLSSSLPHTKVNRIFRLDSAIAAAAYSAVVSDLGPEKLLWHGTSWESAANIARNGFNRTYSGRNGVKLGRGTYFAESASYALRFCGRTTQGARSSARALFLAGVLPGSCCRGEDGLVEPPVRCAKTGARYDSTVDDPSKPKVYCVFRDFQALPLYLAEVM